MSALLTKGLTGSAIALLTNGLLDSGEEQGQLIVGCIHITVVASGRAIASVSGGRMTGTVEVDC